MRWVVREAADGLTWRKAAPRMVQRLKPHLARLRRRSAVDGRSVRGSPLRRHLARCRFARVYTKRVRRAGYRSAVERAEGNRGRFCGASENRDRVRRGNK